MINAGKRLAGLGLSLLLPAVSIAQFGAGYGPHEFASQNDLCNEQADENCTPCIPGVLTADVPPNRRTR